MVYFWLPGNRTLGRAASGQSHMFVLFCESLNQFDLESSTSLPGGNLVDGLPPASSFTCFIKARKSNTGSAASYF